MAAEVHSAVLVPNINCLNIHRIGQHDLVVYNYSLQTRHSQTVFVQVCMTIRNVRLIVCLRLCDDECVFTQRLLLKLIRVSLIFVSDILVLCYIS